MRVAHVIASPRDPSEVPSPRRSSQNEALFSRLIQFPHCPEIPAYHEGMAVSQMDIRSRGIPLDIISRVASRNGMLESMARANNVVDIRHLEMVDFVRVSRALGADWRQIGESLGLSARLACKYYGRRSSRAADLG